MEEISFNWGSYYTPAALKLWKGRFDSEKKERFHQIVSSLDLIDANPFPRGQKTIALLGFKSDEGILRNQGRTGAALGPDELRKAFSNFSIPKDFPLKIVDAGNILCIDRNLEKAQSILGDAVFKLHRLGGIPVLLGGGHEIAWGHYQGIVKAIGKESLAIVNFDAHFDLRAPSKKGDGTSGTSFLQIAEERKSMGLPFHYYCIGIQSLSNTPSLFETASLLSVKTYMADSFFLREANDPIKLLEEAVQNNSHVYVSLCMDVFSSACAPGVSSPQPFGLLPWHLIPLLRFLARSGKLIGVDIAETSPPLDPEGLTVKLGAALLADLITNFRINNLNPS